jgi:aspartate racemase
VCDRNRIVQTIGVLGGMTWVSTTEYYRLLNIGVAERAGGVHSARIAMVSVDMGPIAELMAAGDWDDAGRMLAREARAVEAAGADLFILATNSLHNVWDAIVAELTIPAIHIGDATGAAIRADGHTRVALLGTSYTMELPFLRERLERFGLEVLLPAKDERNELQRVVFEELALGVFRDETRAYVVDVMRRLAADGSTAAILGCTEFGLLVQPEHVDLPLYDTSRLHAAAAVDAALA